MAHLDNPFEKVRQKLVSARLELLSQLAKFHPSELNRTPADNEWSALMQAYHIYIVDGLMFEQMQRVQEEDNPHLPDLEQEGPRITSASETPTSLDAVLGGMTARREVLFEYLSSLAPELWERTCEHARWGSLKFYQLVNILPAHDRDHARQLAALKEALA